MFEELEEWVIMAVRLGAISIHAFELIGLSVGSTIVTVMIAEECIEIYKSMKERRIKNDSRN